MFFKIKKKIIMNNLKKKKTQTPFNLEESENYVLPSDAPDSINNSYFFTAHDVNGDCVVVRLGLRNNKDTEVFFFYKHDGLFLVHPSELYKKDECPVTVKCVEPGKLWEFEFNGELKEYDSTKDKKYKCNIKGRFTATRKIFDFFYDSFSEGMAEAMAREKWVKGYFDEVSLNNQRHYEQTGKLDVEATINKKAKSFSLPCVRDHSFGTRNWDYMDDHIWVCGLTEKGESINFSFVNYPCMKRVYLGYTDLDRNDNVVLDGYKLLDYKICDGNGPDESTIEGHFMDGRTIKIVCKRDANVPIHFDGGKYVFQEGIGEFEINGVKGRGTIEYGFNKDPKRWNY